MGIRGLAACLRHYATYGLLDGSSVVIDGPSMAYFVFNRWREKSPGVHSVLDLPSYTVLGDLAISWLDELRNHNVSISKLYFDAYLPPSKQSTRIARVAQQTATWMTYYGAHPTKLPPRSDTRCLAETLEQLERNHTSARSRTLLPTPPFLVPSIIERLLSHEVYRTVVELIPGEADAYCAAFAAQSLSPCTILTSDSDLLAHCSLSYSSVTVVFLRDMTRGIVKGKDGIKALKFCLSEIAERLDILDHGGLCRLAFELSTSSSTNHTKLRKHLNRIKREAPSPEYRSFSQVYDSLAPLDNGNFSTAIVNEKHLLNLLDPRVSELFLRCSIPGSLTRDYKEEFVPMFLPCLLDCPAKTSVWQPSEDIRKVAYALAANTFDTNRKIVVEYRRVQSAIKCGRMIDILSHAQMVEKAAGLHSLLVFLDSKPSTGDVWYLLSIYLNCDFELAQGRIPLACLVVKNVALSNKLSAASWEMLHFSALVQATIYSLRMLSQIISILEAMGLEMDPLITQLKGLLYNLPPFAKLLSPSEMSQYVLSWNAKEIFSQMTQLFGQYEAFTIPLSKAGHPSKVASPHTKKIEKIGKLANDRDSQPPNSSSIRRNPFSALSGDCTL